MRTHGSDEPACTSRTRPGNLPPLLNPTSSMSIEVASGSYISQMRTVGLKVLKNRLSEYIRLVVAGETILVTDRDRVVAELRPPATSHPMLADAWVASMVREGAMTLPTIIGQGPPPRLPVAPLSELLAELDESRADR